MKSVANKFILLSLISVLLINVISRLAKIPFFYNGLVSIAIAMGIIASINYKSWSLVEKLKYWIAALLVVIFFILVPVTSSRSLTMYMLGRISEVPELKKRDVDTILIDYVLSEGGTMRRLDEQLKTGTITLMKNEEVEREGEFFEITSLGRSLVYSNKIIKEIYNLN